MVEIAIDCLIKEWPDGFKMDAPTLMDGFFMGHGGDVIDGDNWTFVAKHLSRICVRRNVDIHKILFGNFLIFGEKNAHYKTGSWGKKIKEIDVKFLSVHLDDSKRVIHPKRVHLLIVKQTQILIVDR